MMLQIGSDQEGVLVLQGSDYDQLFTTYEREIGVDVDVKELPQATQEIVRSMLRDRAELNTLDVISCE